jgi:hypothetical protein
MCPLVCQPECMARVHAREHAHWSSRLVCLSLADLQASCSLRQCHKYMKMPPCIVLYLHDAVSTPCLYCIVLMPGI